MTEIKINWRGKTRETIEGKMLAMHEMGDVPEDAYRAFADYETVVKFENAESALAAHKEMEHWIGGSVEGVDQNTLREKTNELGKKINDTVVEFYD